MTNYVEGFLFSESMGQLVLIEKQRPDWMAGKYNGVGGKIEPGESAHDAMVREFREETGREIEPWIQFCVLRGDWGSVTFFYAIRDDYNRVETITDEEVSLWDVDYVMDTKRKEIIPNLRWLIQMARSFSLGEHAHEFIVNEVYHCIDPDEATIDAN